MILRPMAEPHLHERQARVLSVALRKIGVELKGKTLQLRIAPIGIPGWAVAARIGSVSLLIIRKLLDVLRDCGSAAVAIHIAARRILVPKPCNKLMPTPGHIVQQALKPVPVIKDGSVIGTPGYDLAGQAVRELQLDGLPVLRITVTGLIGPQHQTGHWLHAGFPRLQLLIPPFTCGLCACPNAHCAQNKKQ